MKRLTVYCFFLTAMLGLALVSACNDNDDGFDKSSVVLISNAQGKIAETAPEAYIVWAGGRRADGRAMPHPDNADVWDFTAVDTSAPQTLSWDMALSRGDWRITVRPAPPMGITYQELTDVWMTVSAAWSLAKMAGVNEPLRTWELYMDINPNFPNPLFLFVLESGKKLFVDSITGDVWSDELFGDIPGDDEDAVLKHVLVADQKIKAVDPKAVVCKANGMNSSGANMSSPSETDMFSFICCALQANGQYRYWEVHYRKNYNWTVWDMPVGYVPDGFSVTDLSKVVMKGETAWETVKANSTALEMMQWELFLPDNANLSKAPVYVFLDQVTDLFAINTATGQVFPY